MRVWSQAWSPLTTSHQQQSFAYQGEKTLLQSSAASPKSRRVAPPELGDATPAAKILERIATDLVLIAARAVA
ncbi:hypothetical protein A4R35_21025 [Thermogemmatispora tikiterensis]|uniref:Uncharacterized protein n=1 Tax=Thermogemmatispora tikiterensis TaxID=1825093 RepID=A0A328VK28_9CHLR|nr:hypothetical protein A4R35_21025 [Thermogemmatispora tikiterensis]